MYYTIFTQNVRHNHTIFIVEYCSKAVKANIKMDNHEGSEKKPKKFIQNKLYKCHSLQLFHCLFHFCRMAKTELDSKGMKQIKVLFNNYDHYSSINVTEGGLRNRGS